MVEEYYIRSRKLTLLTPSTPFGHIFIFTAGAGVLESSLRNRFVKSSKEGTRKFFLSTGDCFLEYELFFVVSDSGVALLRQA